MNTNIITWFNSVYDVLPEIPVVNDITYHVIFPLDHV